MENKKFSFYANLSIQDLYQALKTSENGISDDQAHKRYAQYGPNETNTPPNITAITILINQLYNPFFGMFVIITSVYFFTNQITEFLALIIIVIINVSIGFYQEYHSNKAVSLLRSYLHHTITVRRDGIAKLITINQLVPGDIIIIETGTIIPADCRIIKVSRLMVDEVNVTGNPLPAEKIDTPMKNVTNFYDARNCCFTSSVAVSGSAIAVVFATGGYISVNYPARSLRSSMTNSSVAKGTMELAHIIVVLMILSLLFICFVHMFIRQDQLSWLQLALFSAALAICAVPSALPIVDSFCLTRGAIELHKHKIIVKKLSVIESLGSVEIMCIDGDLFTENIEEVVKKAESLGVQVKILSRDLTFEQKYQIITSLQCNYSVAYFSSSVNDTSILKMVDVGITTADATPIVHDAAEIILLQKNLFNIILGLQEGRRTITNMQKYIKISVSANVGNFYALTFSSLIVNYLPMFPLQLLFLDLITDFPLVAISTDAVNKQELEKPLQYSMKEIGITVFIFGMLCLPLYGAVIFFFKQRPDILQTVWFIVSAFIQLIFILSLRTKKSWLTFPFPSRSLVLLSIIAGLVIIGVPYSKIGHKIFLFQTLAIHDMVIVFSLLFVFFCMVEGIKRLYYRYSN